MNLEWRDWLCLAFVVFCLYRNRHNVAYKWRILTGKETPVEYKTSDEYEAELADIREALNEKSRSNLRNQILIDQAQSALKGIRADVNDCFVSCANCGHEIDLKDLDCMIVASKATYIQTGQAGFP